MICENGIVAIEETLPYSRVYYPGTYGVFLGFSESKDSRIFLCSCGRNALRNAFRIESIEITDRFYQNRTKIWKARVLPSALTNVALNDICFKDKICHLCNQSIPSQVYCYSMYGSAIDQSYGWYINQEAYACGLGGIRPYCDTAIQEYLPDSLKSLISVPLDRGFEKDKKFSESRKMHREYAKQARRINRYLENQVRDRLGVKRMGEMWANETRLFKLIEASFPECTVTHHYRADFLENLELDVFIDGINVGVEYQGIQHYEPVDFFGGKDGFHKTKLRDERKKRLCKEHGVGLVYVTYKEDVTITDIKDRIMKEANVGNRGKGQF